MDEKKSLIQDFREKTEGMNLSGKLDYFWTYYKIPAIVAVFVLIVVVSMAEGIINNALSDPVLCPGVVSELVYYYEDELQEDLENTFPESTGFKKPELVSFYSPANTQILYATTQLMAYLSAGDMDCMICDDATLEYCSNSALDMEITDISDTALGKKAAELGTAPLYFVLFNGTGHEEAAKTYLYMLKTQE